MKKKYIVSLITCIFTVFLIVVIGVSGFVGYQLYLNKVKPVRAFEDSTETMNNYQTAKFDLEMNAVYRIDFKGENSIYNRTINSEFSGYGEMDINEEKMYLDVDMKVTGMKIKMKEIILDETVYLKVGNEDWVVTSLSEIQDSSQAYNIEEIKSEQIWSSLDKDHEYEYKGIEIVNDKEAYNYSLELSRDAMNDFATNLARSFAIGLNAGFGGELSIEEDDINISGIEYEVWVEKSTNLPIKEEITIEEISLEIDDFGTLFVEDIDMSYIYTSFNEEVNIEKPNI